MGSQCYRALVKIKHLENSWPQVSCCSHSLLQGILPTQGLNLGLLCCRLILYHLSPQGSAKCCYIIFIFIILCSREQRRRQNWGGRECSGDEERTMKGQAGGTIESLVCVVMLRTGWASCTTSMWPLMSRRQRYPEPHWSSRQQGIVSSLIHVFN